MTYAYCPSCGQKDSVHAENATKSVCSSCGATFWNNPKATVAVIFIKDGQALFSRRGIEPNMGKYDFPGGFLEYGEDPYMAAVREIKEETSVDVAPDNLQILTAFGEEYIPGTSVADIILVAHNWEGNFEAQDDSAALEWKPVSFIGSTEFVPHYKGLEQKLASYLASSI